MQHNGSDEADYSVLPQVACSQCWRHCCASSAVARTSLAQVNLIACHASRVTFLPNHDMVLLHVLNSCIMPSLIIASSPFPTTAVGCLLQPRQGRHCQVLETTRRRHAKQVSGTLACD
jgi:hypothetical protein